jgi:hypothetical protein
VSTVWFAGPILAKLFHMHPRCRFATEEAAMEDDRVYELRAELNQLLRKQAEVLESRSLGTATDSDLLEYEIRQEIIHEMCNQLAHSVSG